MAYTSFQTGLETPEDIEQPLNETEYSNVTDSHTLNGETDMPSDAAEVEPDGYRAGSTVETEFEGVGDADDDSEDTTDYNLPDGMSSSDRGLLNETGDDPDGEGAQASGGQSEPDGGEQIDAEQESAGESDTSSGGFEDVGAASSEDSEGDADADPSNTSASAGQVDAPELDLIDEFASDDQATVEGMADPATPTAQAGYASFAALTEVDLFQASDDSDNTADLTEAIEQRTDDLQSDDLDDVFEDFANFSGADGILTNLFALPADTLDVSQSFASFGFNGGL